MRFTGDQRKLSPETNLTSGTKLASLSMRFCMSLGHLVTTVNYCFFRPFGLPDRRYFHNWDFIILQSLHQKTAKFLKMSTNTPAYNNYFRFHYRNKINNTHIKISRNDFPDLRIVNFASSFAVFLN